MDGWTSESIYGAIKSTYSSINITCLMFQYDIHLKVLLLVRPTLLVRVETPLVEKIKWRHFPTDLRIILSRQTVWKTYVLIPDGFLNPLTFPHQLFGKRTDSMIRVFPFPKMGDGRLPMGSAHQEKTGTNNYEPSSIVRMCELFPIGDSPI